MTDEELRALVRDVIARRNPNPVFSGSAQTAAVADPAADVAPARTHSSHGLLPLARGGDGDGACLIEPSVTCNHCGYCLSYGH